MPLPLRLSKILALPKDSVARKICHEKCLCDECANNNSIIDLSLPSGSPSTSRKRTSKRDFSDTNPSKKVFLSLLDSFS